MASADSRGASIRLIVADDDERARALLRVLFEELHDARVVAEAADGVEAVELVLAHAPDLILLDVNMPRLNGLEAALRIRDAAPATTVVLHTGELTEELAARAREFGLRIIAKSDFGDGAATLLAF